VKKMSQIPEKSINQVPASRINQVICESFEKSQRSPAPFRLSPDNAFGGQD
jgi:hypothetical protein